MRSPRRRSYGLVLNMTPLIDCVFQLQIFFLITGQFARQESQHELDLPRAESGQQEADEQLQRVLVHLPREGVLVVGGVAMTVDELDARLRQLRQGAAAEELEVRIRADRHLPYREVEPILLACARNGIWRINFAVLPKEDAVD